MSNYPLDRLRGICLALPEVIETGDMGNPSFKVREMMVGAGRQTINGVEHCTGIKREKTAGETKLLRSQ